VYAQDKTRSVAAELDAIHDKLAARIDNISIHSKPLNGDGTTIDLVSQDAKDDSALFRPLSEDILTVSINKPDCGTARKYVKLSDSMQKMAKLVDDTEAKVARLKEELEEVSEDISGVLNEYNTATKSVCQVHEGKRAVFLSDVHAFHESVMDDILDAKKEDQKHIVEANRKLQAFAASLV